jgi:ankyrin repeat protein
MILLYWSKQKKTKKPNKSKHDSNHFSSTNEAPVFSIDCKDFSETTSLMKASINGHLKIVELLLRFGANPRVENARNETALTLAVM